MSDDFVDFQDLVTEEEAGKILNVEPEVIFSLVDTNQIPHRWVNGRVMLSRSELRRWLRRGLPKEDDFYKA